MSLVLEAQLQEWIFFSHFSSRWNDEKDHGEEDAGGMLTGKEANAVALQTPL